MKRSYFGEMRIEPGDDLYALWNEEFQPEDPARVRIRYRDVEQDSEFGWTCSLSDDDSGEESECHGFDSEAQLLEFLHSQGATPFS